MFLRVVDVLNDAIDDVAGIRSERCAERNPRQQSANMITEQATSTAREPALRVVGPPLEVHEGSSPSSSLAINNLLYLSPCSPFPPRTRASAIRSHEVRHHAKRPARKPRKRGMVVGNGKAMRMLVVVRRDVRRAMRRGGCMAVEASW